MKLERWSQVVEIAASVAVVMTMGVLIFQVKENTRATRSATRYAIAAEIQNRTLTLALHPDLLRILARSSAEAELSGQEVAQLNMLYASLMTAAEEAYFQFQEGNISQEFFDARMRKSLVNFQGRFADEYVMRATTTGTITPEFSGWLSTYFASRAKSSDAPIPSGR